MNVEQQKALVTAYQEGCVSYVGDPEREMAIYALVDMGLLKRKYLRRKDPSLYVLTSEGKREAKWLSDGNMQL